MSPGASIPPHDLELILTELMLADLDHLNNKLERARKQIRNADAEAKFEFELASSFAEELGQRQIAEARYERSESEKGGCRSSASDPDARVCVREYG